MSLWEWIGAMLLVGCAGKWLVAAMAARAGKLNKEDIDEL